MPGPKADDQQRPQRQAASKTEYEDLGEGALSGNLTRDPELRFTAQGRAIVTLRIAETERVQDQDSGAWTDGETQFYDVTAWGDQATNCAEVLQRGDRVAVVGRWQKQTWQGDDDTPRSKNVLVARDIGPSLLFKEVSIARGKKGAKR